MEVAKKSETSQAVALNDDRRIPPKPKAKVLDEDKYLEKLETIIQRDFFPDIAKLKAQTDYFDAVQANDVEKIKQLQEKFSSRRTDKPVNTPRSPAFFETPDLRQNNEEPRTYSPTAAPDDPQPSTSVSKNQNDPDSSKKDSINVDNVSVDKFLYKYTSEDNSSFDEILDDAERKLRQKHAWLFNAESEHAQRMNSAQALPQADEQLAIGAGPRRAGVDNWTYKAKNAVMYIPEGVQWTQDELVQRQKMNEREIVHENTRLDVKPYGSHASADALNKAASIQAAVSKGKVDAMGNEIGLGQFGYRMNYVVTPSPAPGVNESPMMTWGEIEGSPFRLDAGDTVVPKTPGPTFKMPEIPLRDQLAQCITTEMAKKHRQKKLAAMRQMAANTPTKFGSAKSMERLSSMSPAAQRLATAKFGIRVGTDKALKASYTPSPLRSNTSTTPSILTPTLLASDTPVGSQSSTRQTPSKRSMDVDESNMESLTDNLLNLQAKKPKAADYF